MLLHQTFALDIIALIPTQQSNAEVQLVSRYERLRVGRNIR